MGRVKPIWFNRDEFMNTLEQRCKNLMLIHKWTQKEISNKIGVTKQVVSNWQWNVARPEINHLISLAKVFDVTTDYLLCIANRMTFPYCVGSIATGVSPKINHHSIWELKFSLTAISISCSSSLNVPWEIPIIFANFIWFKLFVFLIVRIR